MKHSPAITSTSLDLHALTYCLCSSDCQLYLRINLQNFTSLFCKLNESCNRHIRVLVIRDASKRNLQLFFSLPKRLFYDLIIMAREPVDSVVGDILSDGRLTALKV